MALTKKQREGLLKILGFLSGLGYTCARDKNYHSIAEAMDVVCNDLRNMLDEDGGSEE